MERETLFLRQAVMVGGAVFHREGDDDPFAYRLHRHDHISEMFLVERGEGEFNIDGILYKAEAGTLLFYQRNIWHEEQSTAYPFAGMYIAFKGLELRGLPPLFYIPSEAAPVIRLGDRASEFAREFRQCIEEFSRVEPESRTIASHMLGALLARLARHVHYREPLAPPKPSQSVVQRARKHIEEHYDSAITLHSLSKLTYVGEYYLAHLFKDEMGISPIQYLIHCRMEVAKRYLTMSDYNVRHIAGLVGYQSENTFHGLFKRTTGLTPLQYRRRRREEVD